MTVVDKGEGGGKNRQKIVDVIYGQPLLYYVPQRYGVSDLGFYIVYFLFLIEELILSVNSLSHSASKSHVIVSDYRSAM